MVDCLIYFALEAVAFGIGAVHVQLFVVGMHQWFAKLVVAGKFAENVQLAAEQCVD